MKSLLNHTLIYDQECPMCNLYTGAFIKAGMLDGNGRVAYTQVAKQTIPSVDWERARNEIALVNRNDNSVKYGVDSLTAIIGHSMPIFNTIFKSRIFLYFIRELYFFISYNRKVIAPGPTPEGPNACTPSINYGYRWAYIIMTWLITSWVLLHYTYTMVPFVPRSHFGREFMICGGQIVFQALVLLMVNKERLIHYLGNVMTVSFGGALLLLPMIMLNKWIDSPLISLGYFGIVVGLMFLEHIRRVKLLGLPSFISATWVLYRLIALLFIL